MLKNYKWIWIIGLCLAAAAMASEAAPVGEAAAEAEKPSIFSGSWAEAFWTLIWFFLLLIVLWKTAWKPVIKALSARQEHIQSEIDEAEKTRRQAQQVLSEYHSKLADAERQGRDIINQRIKQAQDEAKEVESQNRKQIDQMKARLDMDIEREKMDAQDQLWQQAGEIVRQLGQEVFAKSLNDQDNQRIIQQAVERLRQAHQPKNQQ